MAEVLDEKFFIRSSDEGFKNRQADVFGKLNALEDGHNSAMTSWNNDLKRKLDDSVENDDDDAVTDKSENVNAINTDEESFKVPIGIPPKRASRNNSVPDYSIHPEKWTKYTLSDVSDECISEDANSEAAIDFLTSRWKTCSDYEEQENCEDLGSSAASFNTELAKMKDIKFGKTNSKLASPPKRFKRLEETKKSGGDTGNIKLSHVDVDTTEYDEEKTDQQPTSTVITEQVPPQSSELFRSVRKRQRNIRSVAQDDNEVNDE